MPPDSPSLPPLPSFVIIGAPGCATRWLRFNLDRHPEIYAPPRFGRPPAPFLYDDEALSGHEVTIYRRSFAGWAGEPIVGAWEPDCLVKQTRPTPGDEPLNEPQQVARRMAKVLPDARLIALVRDPVDRLEDDFLRRIERGDLPPEADLFKMVMKFDMRMLTLDLSAAGMYAEGLKEFGERFGDQLLVMLHDDIRGDPDACYKTALAHIGASTDFIPDQLDRVLFAPRHVDSAPRLTPDQRTEVFNFYYRGGVADLAAMTGRDLSGWDPSLVTQREPS